jgi:hypothetical protein
MSLTGKSNPKTISNDLQAVMTSGNILEKMIRHYDKDIDGLITEYLVE